MRRLAVLLTALLVACDVGSVVQGTGTDGGGSGSADAPGAAPAHMHANPLDGASNPSNAGHDCMAANCHGTVTPGAGANQYAFAGTVYTAAGGTTGAAGVTVHVGTLSTVSDQAGNFYYPATTITFPVNTDVTSKSMATPINVGSCNGSSCHQNPGGTSGGIFQ